MNNRRYVLEWDSRKDPKTSMDLGWVCYVSIEGRVLKHSLGFVSMEEALAFLKHHMVNGIPDEVKNA